LNIVVATNNNHKIQEIKNIFQDSIFSVISYLAISNKQIDVEETGKTFQENAILKLAPFAPIDNHIFLADDSGLEVAALNGKPGIYSARYAGTDTSALGLCTKLLSELSNTTNRKANFTTVIAIKFPNGKIKTVEGKVFGTITSKICGKNGFGYDPVFQPNNHTITFAEMPPTQKNKISHRAIALKKAKKEISQFLS
jgi:XTP/dITP diphosphohydrolase